MMKKIILIFISAAIFAGCASPMDTPVTVKIGAQSVTITAGTAGSATFTVNTEGVANGTKGTIQWFTTSAGTTTTTAPAGITVTVSAVSANKATVTATATAAVVAGSYFFKVTIDGVTSGVVTLTISADAYASFKADATPRFEGAGNATVKLTDATHLFFADKGGLFAATKSGAGYASRDGSAYYFIEWGGGTNPGTKTSPTLRTHQNPSEVVISSLQILKEDTATGTIWGIYKLTPTSAEGKFVRKLL